jgi:FkbM family methyltransferase
MQKIKKFYRTIKVILSGAIRFHSSQYGEDILLHKRFRKSNKEYFYIDVGAHHPYHISNTAYLWSLGWNGVNVDASSAVIDEFEKSRPKDLNLFAGVVSEEAFSTSTTITFYSNKDIDNCATCDFQLAGERGLINSVDVPCLTLKKIVEKAHMRYSGCFGFLNIDIEGLDDQIIQDIDDWPQKPLIIMIEIYSKNILDVFKSRTYDLLFKSGYLFTERIGHTAVFELKNI